MYQIEITDSNIPVTILCPSTTSMQECVYERLVRAMREDVAMSVKCYTMREIVNFYATQFASLDDFDKDEMATGEFETYNGSAKFKVKYTQHRIILQQNEKKTTPRR